MPEHMGQTVYFEKPGRANTGRTLEIARQRAEALGVRTILVPTTTGATGVAACTAFSGLGSTRLVVVTHSTGFRGPDQQELTHENRAAIEAAGGRILTCTHAFGGVGRAIRRKLSTYQVDEVMAYTLRTFGEGMKVALEIALMAADAGLVRCDEEAVALGGTGRGVDTAVVLVPAHAQDFFGLRVAEILCKPRLGLER